MGRDIDIELGKETVLKSEYIEQPEEIIETFVQAIEILGFSNL